MNKEKALASLGQASLLRPAMVREALHANERLKLLLTLLQAAAHHARPGSAAVDLSREIAATDIGQYEDVRWLRELPNLSEPEPAGIHLPGLERLRARLKADLAVMAAPLAGEQASAEFDGRLAYWQERLAASGDHLGADELEELTRATRARGDSLHLLVMDLHKAVNALAASLSEQLVAGAQTWQLSADGADARRVEAFMRGLHRTAPARLDHPGLDTSATRDGETLLIQNDIGTNDAHVLVIQVRGLATSLTYSDLHATRFAFFQRSLAQAGASWGETQTRAAAALNGGDDFHVGIASFVAPDEAALYAQLEAIASRIVFLIDWNRARKQLVRVCGKKLAVEVLEAAAARGCGHMGWLGAGGARLVWDAMASLGDTAFRLGERLDDVLTPEAARDFLVQLLDRSWHAARARQPAQLVADEARLLLARTLAGRHRGFELLQEHAALCHALASALEEGLLHGALQEPGAALRLARRARDWEHQADLLVSRCRDQAQRQPRWQGFARLLEGADEVADALEEAAFTLAALAQCGHAQWSRGVLQPLEALARTVAEATQDHVRAVEIAAALAPSSDARDHQEYLDALWRVQQAERGCDQLHRAFRLEAARELAHAGALQLGNELAGALEAASDAVLAFGWRLREHALHRAAGEPR